jgi:short-subunit dehydrogenase
MKRSSENTIAVVTGASEGIGLAVARLLSAGGAKVVLAARSEGKLKKAAGKLAGAVAITADLRKPGDREGLVRKTMERFGRIDILVNNAGQGLYAAFEKTELEDYRSIMELNVYAVTDLMQKAIPIMRKQGGGRIINISSMASKGYYRGLSAYSSTKYALNALSLIARKELEKDGIVVSVMHPKMTATRFGLNAVGGGPAHNSAADTVPVDTAEAVAKKVMKLIESGEAEAGM